MKQLIFFSIFCLIAVSPELWGKNGADKVEASRQIDDEAKNDTIRFNKVSHFKILDEDQNQYLSDKYFLTYSMGNTFDIMFDKSRIGRINFDGREYSGPGYDMWLYQADDIQNLDIIIIEAKADPGTAWYYVIILHNNQIKQSFFIDEPRANSEESMLSDFISIEYVRSEFIFKLRKDLIARYSSVPNEIKQDKHHYIISLQSFIQDSIATMTSSLEEVKIGVKWTGTGSITANGMELYNDFDLKNAIATANGSVVLMATGDAQLTNLICYNNSLSALNVTKCPLLIELACWNNSLTALDVSNCPKLKYLYCYNNSLTDLDLTNCTELEYLRCRDNSLTDLNLTNCPMLIMLHCQDNSLSALHVTNCTKLTELWCDSNFLTTLDVTNCPELTELKCKHNSLTALDITNCTKLNTLECNYNSLTTLDVTNCPKLTVIECGNNSLTALDVTNCTELQRLSCAVNSLTELDITNCTKLGMLFCPDNSLSTLDVTNCPKLWSLMCSDNSLTELDVTNCTELRMLHCSNNSLFALDVTNCTNLREFYANYQTPILPATVPKRTKLRINNPVTFAGEKIWIYNISHSGKYKADNITWKVSGESGEVTFYFITELPEGAFGDHFSGTATLPWTRK